MARELAGFLFIVVLIGAVFGLAAALRRRRVDPELTRKVAHVATALVPLPFVVRSLWTGLALAVTAAVAVAGLRRRGRLGFLDDVRRSHASEYSYVAAVTLAFVAGRGEPLWFIAPVLTLGLADAAAAVVGTRYGRRRARVFGNTRSVEGSVACALTAAVVVGGSSALVTGRFEPWLGLVAGVLAALVEASSPRGADNLLVPVAVLALLLGWPAVSPPALGDEVRTAALLIAPVILAGLTHHVVRKVNLLAGLQVSIDELLFAGREVFGRNKTLRGFVVMPVATAAFFAAEGALLRHVCPAASIGLPGWSGAVVGLGYVVAELPNSWLKRRAGLAPGAHGPGVFRVLDLVDSAVGCGLAFLLLSQPLPVVAVGLVVAPLAHAVVNLGSWAVRLRSSPW
jgi:dolichol kinase